MKVFTDNLVEKSGIRSLNDISSHIESIDKQPMKQSLLQLLARCYLKIGEWKNVLKEDNSQHGVVLPETLQSYFAATQYDRVWYKAWHAWAFANFEVVSYHEKIEDNIPVNILIQHVVPSVHGFFRSISLSVGSSLQDTLRLLTLWFKYGQQQDVNAAISEGFNTVSVDTWLEVIPQLIARIHSPSPLVRKLIHQLLADVGKKHPQALVYSLTVASKSQSATRKTSALAILDKMRTHSADLVEQALLVSQELIRVAILWHEMWHEGLEEASKLYFTDQNIEGMFSTLEPLHQMMERVRVLVIEESNLSRALKRCEKLPLTKPTVAIWLMLWIGVVYFKERATMMILTKRGICIIKYFDVLASNCLNLLLWNYNTFLLNFWQSETSSSPCLEHIKVESLLQRLVSLFQLLR